MGDHVIHVFRWLKYKFPCHLPRRDFKLVFSHFILTETRRSSYYSVVFVTNGPHILRAFNPLNQKQNQFS